MHGKKTYSGLVAVVVGIVMVVAQVKFGIPGLMDYGLALIAGGVGLAGYGRWAATAVTVTKKTRKPRAKKVKVVNA